MNLYLQILTQTQTGESVELLRFIPLLVQGQKLGGDAKIFAQGEISHSKFSKLDALIAKVAAKHFNQLEVAFKNLKLCDGLARGSSLKAFFSVSPTCALWLPTHHWRTGADRVSDNCYMTAKSHEEAVKFHHVSKEPSVLELLLEIPHEKSPERILDGCAECLAKTLPEDFDKLQPFGCGDVVEPVLIPELKKSVLMPERFQIMMKLKPPGYSELGERFEALHPLMFGSKRLCAGISSALGDESKLTIASHAKDFALVRLVTTCDKESAKSRAAAWLVTGSEKLT